MSTAITGRDLLTLVKDHPDENGTDLAVMAGYVRTNRAGEAVPNVPAFKDALLEAKGLSIKAEPRGRVAANETTVHASGAILLGSIYAKAAGVGPGDVYEIDANAETGQIILTVIQRAEGSPLPFKEYARKPKAAKAVADTAPASLEPVAA